MMNWEKENRKKERTIIKVTFWNINQNLMPVIEMDSRILELYNGK